MFPKKYKFSTTDFIASKSSGEFTFVVIFFIPFVSICLFIRWKKFGSAFVDVASLAPIIFLLLLVLFLLAITFYQMGPRIAVSTSGIWTRRSGFVEWEKIWYQDLVEQDGSSNMYGPYFYFKTLDSDTDYKVSLQHLDKTIDEIRETISKFSGKQFS